MDALQKLLKHNRLSSFIRHRCRLWYSTLKVVFSRLQTSADQYDMENAAMDEQIRLYCRNFYAISTQTVFLPGTDMDFTVVVYDAGIILEVKLKFKIESQDLDKSTTRPIPLYRVSSIHNAFDILKIDIGDYLDERQLGNFIDAVAADVQCFKGTVRFHDRTWTKIYFIKEKDENLLDLSAVRNDISHVIEANNHRLK